jgi:hypothetical protein
VSWMRRTRLAVSRVDQQRRERPAAHLLSHRAGRDLLPGATTLIQPADPAQRGTGNLPAAAIMPERPVIPVRVGIGRHDPVFALMQAQRGFLAVLSRLHDRKLIREDVPRGGADVMDRVLEGLRGRS